MAAAPRRGEIWLVDLDPAKGSEIQKIRPVVVVSSNAMNRLPIRLIVPITTFQDKHERRIWAVPVEPEPGTGLTSKSTIMAEQCRCAALERFVRLQGLIPPDTMEEVDAALKIVLDLS